VYLLFIAGPQFVWPDVNAHSSADHDPVFVQYGHILATTFHPELTDDSVFHDYLIREV